MRTAVLLGGAILAVTSCTGTATTAEPSGDATSSASPTAASPSATPTPTPTGPDYLELLSGGQLTSAAICDDYQGILGSFQDTLKTRKKKGEPNSSDPYKAAKYSNSAPWVSGDSEEELDELLAPSVDSALNEVTNGRAGQVQDRDEYITASMAECGLASDLADARSQARSVNSLAQEIRSAAASKPWYPKGFFEIQDGVAGKWIRGASDPCGYGPACWYWTLDVASRDGCSSGVYVEVNFTRNDSVQDWSNDSLPALRPMQKGRLQFYTYDRSVDSIQIADVSCL